MLQFAIMPVKISKCCGVMAQVLQGISQRHANPFYNVFELKAMNKARLWFRGYV